jgi:hypothetical protein
MRITSLTLQLAFYLLQAAQPGAGTSPQGQGAAPPPQQDSDIRAALTIISFFVLNTGLIGTTFKFAHGFYKRRWGRYDKKLLCVVTSRSRLPSVNGRPLPLLVEDGRVATRLSDEPEGGPKRSLLYENAGVICVRLKNVGTQTIKTDDIAGGKFQLSFGKSKVVKVYKRISPERVDLGEQIQGGTITFSPQYIDPGLTVDMEVVLENYDGRASAQGRISNGGPVRMRYWDTPGRLAPQGRAFTGTLFLLMNFTWFLFFLPLLFSERVTGWGRILVATVMGAVFASAPYVVYRRLVKDEETESVPIKTRGRWKGVRLRARKRVVTTRLKDSWEGLKLSGFPWGRAKDFLWGRPADFLRRHKLFLWSWLFAASVFLTMLFLNEVLLPSLYGRYKQALVVLLDYVNKANGR